MAAPITYLQFHALFVVPVLAGLALTARYRLGRRRDVLVGTAVLAGLAAVYTTPWDNYLIVQGAWWYGEGTVLVRFWEAPLGEYLFFVLQPVVAALWVARFDVDTDRPLATPLRVRAVGLVAAAVVGLAGWALLQQPGGLYLGSLLAWGSPILALQWAFGWPYLVSEWRTVAAGTLAPTAYLWLADALALSLGVWTIAETHTLGPKIPLLDLPIEEAVFFLLTTLFVVQGLVLYVWLRDQWR